MIVVEPKILAPQRLRVPEELEQRNLAPRRPAVSPESGEGMQEIVAMIVQRCEPGDQLGAVHDRDDLLPRDSQDLRPLRIRGCGYEQDVFVQELSVPRSSTGIV